MRIHDTFETAVQAQPFAVITSIGAPAPPDDATDVLVGATEKLHAAC
jgi:hypothetical protein